jgi:hypothetical protein
MSDVASDNVRAHIGDSIAAVFALYMLVGAGVTLYTGKWFVGFPEFFTLTYWFAGATGAHVYVAAIIIGALGGLILFAYIRRWVRENAG